MPIFETEFFRGYINAMLNTLPGQDLRQAEEIIQTHMPAHPAEKEIYNCKFSIKNPEAPIEETKFIKVEDCGDPACINSSKFTGKRKQSSMYEDKDSAKKEEPKQD